MQHIQRQQKLERIMDGNSPRVLDLFAGCGGLSLGFKAAGFDIIGAVESDPIAAKSHSRNFHSDSDLAFRELHARGRDITDTDPGHLMSELVPGHDAAAVVDIIIGGPPCQAFARVGRAKLREVAEHPEAFRQDPRGNLYLRYLEYVRRLHPLALLMENVPDVLNYGGHNIPDEMCEVLSDLGYECRYTLLNAVYYGVPQMRERLFLIAYAKELKSQVAFPSPTHWIELPKGYHGSRQVALKSLRTNLFNQTSFYTPPPESSPSLLPAVTAREALADLPPITLHLEGKLKRGTRRFNSLVPYQQDIKLSSYMKLMREWPGFEANGGVTDHVIRSLPRDYAIFNRMHPGDQYPEAHAHAMDIFNEEMTRRQEAGERIISRSKEYRELLAQFVPPYDAGKFPNKWRKMEPDAPARTLMAHLGKDSYSHIHYDSDQARTISVREAARLQSFPDGFQFEGTMNPAFRQIGNAVPPLMARALAEVMQRALQTCAFDEDAVRGQYAIGAV
jgi:DNA (cytosine-5)-methyltransferase 1